MRCFLTQFATMLKSERGKKHATVLFTVTKMRLMTESFSATRILFEHYFFNDLVIRTYDYTCDKKPTEWRVSSVRCNGVQTSLKKNREIDFIIRTAISRVLVIIKYNKTM